MREDYIDKMLDEISNTPQLDQILDVIEAPVGFADGIYTIENTETLAKTLGLLERLTGEDQLDILETAVLVGLKMRIAIELYGGGLKGEIPS